MNKKTFTNKKRKAFSLIELSIVLIIIGLLVAGVTGGASLIKNAELRGIASEARGYQTAVNSFFAKYNGLPGDDKTVIGTMTGTITGNTPDGLIQYYSARSDANSYLGRAENNIAWQVLKNDNFVTDSFTPGSADASSVGGIAPATTVNSPNSKSKNGTWAFDSITVNSSPQNVVVISAGVSAMSGGTTAATSLTALVVGGTSASATGNSQLLTTDALSIDTKVDDGVATTGKVTALNTTTNNNCFIGSAYTTTNNSYKACALAFQVDPNS
jgi:prepilin-type N-terminal cleavage/methylation domain-containing protein